MRGEPQKFYNKQPCSWSFIIYPDKCAIEVRASGVLPDSPSSDDIIDKNNILNFSGLIHFPCTTS